MHDRSRRSINIVAMRRLAYLLVLIKKMEDSEESSRCVRRDPCRGLVERQAQCDEAVFCHVLSDRFERFEVDDLAAGDRLAGTQ